MAEENGNGNGRSQPITVSQDFVQKSLLEMKIDLLDRLDERLTSKADAKDIPPLVTAVAGLTDWRSRAERGEFTEAQKNAVMRWVEGTFTARAKEAWGGWERRLALSGSLFGLCTAIGGVAAMIHFYF